MNKLTLVFSLIFILSFSVKSQSNSFFVQSESKYSIEETIEIIKTEAAETGWKVPIVHELHKSVAKAGYHVLPVFVIEVCNPELAGQVLSKINLRVITPLMPIRFSVWESEEGKVMISRMNQDLIGQMLEGEDKDLVLKSCSSADDLLKDVLK
ncbi:MAG: DUF302 domain-containing protein [Bacteroidetes bacterium]|nr:DUF302 domain-containing protein [Bacteroidota bacterium]